MENLEPTFCAFVSFDDRLNFLKLVSNVIRFPALCEESEYKLIDYLNPYPTDGGKDIRNTVEKAQLLRDLDKELRILAADIDASPRK